MPYWSGTFRCIHTRMHSCWHTYTWTHPHVCTPTCMHTFTHTHTHRCAHTRAATHVCTHVELVLNAIDELSYWLIFTSVAFILIGCSWMKDLNSRLIRFYYLYGEERLLTADPAVIKYICVTNSKNYRHSSTSGWLEWNTLAVQVLADRFVSLRTL